MSTLGKKISILNFDLSDNSLGRASLIAKLLNTNFNVEIIGPAKKGYIWEPCKDSDIAIKIIDSAKFPLLLFKLPAILKEINGDIIYAIKPRFTSFGIGLIKKFISKKPLILDIDDWETGFYLGADFFGRISRLIHIFNPNGFFWTWLLQFFIRFSDKQTTVSTFLQKKYGGIIIPHAKDTDFLNPEYFNKDTVKRDHNLERRKVIMFFGTPRKHKGVEDAIKAVTLIKDDSVILLIVGCKLDGEYENHLKEKGGERVQLIGKVSIKQIPYYLSMADVVIVPQRQTTDTIGQIPSKLFDAMAMAKPIISTRVSDIPLILDDCGIIIEPEDIDALKEKIEWLLNDTKTAKLLGQRARQRCIEKYSLNSVRPSLCKIIEEIIENEN